MKYLGLARAAVYETRETRKVGTEEVTGSKPEDEKNEENEESARTTVLSSEEAEQLKAQIVAASVEPAEFDRAEYDRLWARWGG